MSTLLLGPGPSNAPDAVLDALHEPLIGHLDPRFLKTLDATKRKLRQVMLTENEVTFPVSGTGSAGTEAAMANVLEEGDTVVVGVNGVFGGRAANLAERYGVKAVRVEAPWGEAVKLDDLAAAAREHRPAIIAVISGETSTGVYQPMDGLGELARETGSLLLADCVTSLAGMPVRMDDWGVDLIYSGTQKCLNCPPGLAPVSFSERAVERFEARTTPVPSFYLDLGEILKYVRSGEGKRAYHHTAPVSMVAALDKALDVILDEGLEARWARHEDAATYLIGKLEPLGIEPLVKPEHRLHPLTTVKIPESVADEAAVRSRLLERHDIELGAGLGPLAGKVWRIGLMGVNARREVVDRFIDALTDCMKD